MSMSSYVHMCILFVCGSMCIVFFWGIEKMSSIPRLCRVSDSYPININSSVMAISVRVVSDCGFRL